MARDPGKGRPMQRGFRCASVAFALGAAVLAEERDAAAWYLPEHAEITRIALERYSSPAVAKAIQGAVDDARDVGLPLCLSASVPFLTIPTNGATGTPVAACIPYTALPALAGDHANDAAKLWSFLTTTVSRWPFGRQTVAAMVIGAGVAEFQSFRDSAEPFYQRVYVDAPTPGATFTMLADLDLDGRRFTRDLDARLQLVDRDYSSRAAGSKTHFQNAAEPIQDVLNDATRVGNVDNALAQMLAHHARSMQLALASRQQPGVLGQGTRAMAMLEHAFAVHFLEDAFAAGHIGTEPAINPSISRLQRHDYLNRTGLAATRALAVGRCDPAAGSPDLPVCWTAYGDGYMNGDNMPLVAEAVARVQLEFARALQPLLFEDMRHDARCTTVTAINYDVVRSSPWVDEQADDQCELTRAAALLDPAPKWTQTNPDPSRRMTWGLVVAIIEDAERAMKDLASSLHDRAILAPASCDDSAGAQPGVLTQEVLGHPLDPCRDLTAQSPSSDGMNPLRLRSGQACASRVNWTTSSLTQRELRWGDVDVTLWRPLLVAWPTSQADIRTIRGSDSFGYGFAYTAGYGASALVSLADSQTPSAFGIGCTGGLSYRADSVLPGRSNRAIAELNAGLAATEVNAIGGTRLALIGMAEFRMPLISLLSWGLAGYLTRSSDVMSVISKNWGIGVFGIRGYVVVPGVIPRVGPPEGLFVGGDLEVFYVSLGRPDSVQQASIGVEVNPELRLRLGLIRPGALAQEGSVGSYGPSIALELARGYSWFF